MSEREDFYDAEIAPALLALAEKCKAHGMSLAAAVEWEPGETGSTVILAEGHGWFIEMVAVVARSQANADLIIGHMLKVGREHGHNSAYLHLLESKL